MLILTRKTDEAVRIVTHRPTEIRIRVLAVRGNQVRLGFEAGYDDASIRREEIADITLPPGGAASPRMKKGA